MTKGKVYLVGAGPGDPKLITVKGLEALQKSDAIVYDRLASPRLLAHAKPDAVKIYVGKLPDRHTMKQEEINQLLVDLAHEGKIVTRLKGGDPAVFGRVGEEAEQLIREGIEIEIIPGITSAVAVPIYAGIPVTHRDYNAAFSIVTGHEKPEKLDSSIHWEKLATATETLIFLMGVAKIRYISEQLINYGRAEQTPVALIRWGTTIQQQTLVGTLATIADQVEAARFEPPAIIIVGEVVKLREKLQWFERKPLFGKRVLVTRSRNQASKLAEQIDDLGGEAVEFPVIHVQSPARPAQLAALDDALHSLSQFHHVLFTSVNGVEFFFQRLRQLGLDIRSMSQAAISAVGPKTAEALLSRGLQVEALPSTYQAEGLLEVLLPRLKKGEKVLLPRSNIARSYLVDQLTKLQLEVTAVDAYETVISDDGADEIIARLERGEIHLITFTSSSTVINLFQILKDRNIDPTTLLASIELACIGELTAQTVQATGLNVHYMAEEATIEALLAAIMKGTEGGKER